MTANELIDKIEKIQNNKENIDWYVLQFVVPMLRQQQTEIEALKGQLLKYDRLAWEDLDKVRSIESAILKNAREK